MVLQLAVLVFVELDVVFSVGFDLEQEKGPNRKEKIDVSHDLRSIV